MMVNVEIKPKDVAALRNLLRWAKTKKVLKEQEAYGMKWVSFCQDMDKKLENTHFVGLN